MTATNHTYKHDRSILFSKKCMQKKEKIQCRKMTQSLSIYSQQRVKVTTHRKEDNLPERSQHSGKSRTFQRSQLFRMDTTFHKGHNPPSK